MKISNDEIIKKYTEMKSLNKLCIENKVGRTNLLKNKVTKENKEKVTNAIIKEVVDIYNFLLWGVM